MTTETDEDALAAAYERGLAAEKSGDIDGAAAAYADVLQIDPLDRAGAAVRLAALGRGETPPRAPEAYVATLFDQHSEVFDSLLVDQLGYDAPLLLRQRLLDVAPGPYDRLLDLGCGTGLTAEAVEDLTTHRTGVDMSEGMLDAAHEKEIYAELYIADAEGFLTSDDAQAARWDLITATDMLPYLGGLESLFDAVAARLSPGGVFGFSSETLAEAAFEGADFRVGPKHRFAHRSEYVARLLAARGFTLLSKETIVVRYDEGEPVPGDLFVARAEEAAAS